MSRNCWILSQKIFWDAGLVNLMRMSLRTRFAPLLRCRLHNLLLPEEESRGKECKLTLDSCCLKPMRSPGTIKLPFLLPLHWSKPPWLSLIVTPLAPSSCTSSLNKCSSAIKCTKFPKWPTEEEEEEEQQQQEDFSPWVVARILYQSSDLAK